MLSLSHILKAGKMLSAHSARLVRLLAILAILALVIATFSAQVVNTHHEKTSSTLYIPAMSRFILNKTGYLVIPFAVYINGTLVGNIVHESGFEAMVYVPNTPSSTSDNHNISVSSGEFNLDFPVMEGNYFLIMHGVPGERLLVANAIRVVTGFANEPGYL